MSTPRRGATLAAAQHRRRRRRFVAVAVSAIVLDLASKTAASSFLTSRVNLPGPLDLQLVHNSGVAFGGGKGVPTWILVAATAAIAATLAVAGWQGVFASPVAVGLVVGGAAANVVDRIEGGTVIDMLHLGWWPTFNLADACITTGAALLILNQTRPRRRDSDQTETLTPATQRVPVNPIATLSRPSLSTSSAPHAEIARSRSHGTSA